MLMKCQKSLLWISVCLLVLAGSACTPAEPVRYEAEFIGLFDTLTQMVGYAESRADFEEQIRHIKNDLEMYHQLFDIYNSYPGLTNLKDVNDKAGQGPVPVDRKIIDLLLFSLEMHEKTQGRVNVAMGSVLKIWHNHRTAALADPATAQVPEPAILKEADRHTNIADLIVDPRNNTVALRDPAMSLDVGAIAKGYAVEQAAQAAEKRGGKHLLISVGGNVRAIGYRSRKPESWRAGIENPVDPDNGFLAVLNIHDLSVATSGSYERYYEANGRRYHHIIDVDTLFPENNYLSVTVVTPDAGLADVLSTALFCLPYETGLGLLESFEQTEALWCLPDGSLLESPGLNTLRSDPAK
jgi:thiamine biosynthesis lipoprotein